MGDSAQVNAVEGLFAKTASGPRLLGSRCATCTTPYFPRSESCHNPDCPGTDMQPAEFGPNGTLWSVALQNYPPPSPAVIPEPYSPYAVGVVDMPEGLRVLGRLETDDPEGVPVGADVELVISALGRNDAGEDVVSWQWKPL
jgi:uncharacterized OB-fold protein